MKPKSSEGKGIKVKVSKIFCYIFRIKEGYPSTPYSRFMIRIHNYLMKHL
jgi:hypothetical protein